MTRKDLRNAFERLVGSSSNESVLSELRSSIVRSRLQTPVNLRRPSRDLIEIITGRSITDTVLRSLRLAASKAPRLR